MKRSIARQWAKALESGEYKQGIGRLRNGDKFCCLGVLCNLHAQAHPEIAGKQKNKNNYLDMLGELPYQVMKWANVKNNEGHFYDSQNLLECNLITLNDTEKLNFSEIAKVIRKHWKAL